MADQFVAEIRIFPFSFAPKGWALCNGQLLPISQNTALFSLLGTMYGGNGISNFALPNLQGSAALHAGQGNGPGLTDRVPGETGGTPNVSLIQSEIPNHTHELYCNSGDGSSASPVNNVWAGPSADRDLYWYNASIQLNSDLNTVALTIAGGSQPHNNLMPYLTLNYCIAMQGIYPPRGN